MTATERWVRNDGFEIALRDGREHLFHPHEGTLVPFTDHVRKALDTATDDAPARLRRLRLLVPDKDRRVAAGGVASRSESPLGHSWHLAPPAAGWVAIGCPFASGARPDANPAAGTALLRAGLSRRLSATSSPAWSWPTARRVSAELFDVRDYGDVLFHDATDTAEMVHARLAFAVNQVCDEGSWPLVLGGDHSLGHPTIDTVLRHHPDLRVVHLDAHADRAPRTVAAAAHCGNFMTWLTEAHPGLPVLTVGVRGFDSGFPADSPGPVTYVTAAELRRGDGMAALERFVTGHRVHLTVDADVLDPAYAAEVAYPVPGGLDVLDVEAIVRTVVDAAHVVGADFTEICAGSGQRNSAASSLTQVISSLLDVTALKNSGT